MSNQNQNRQHGNRNHGRDRNRGGRTPNFTKGEQLEIIFVEKDFGSGKRLVSYLQDDTIIYPKSLRFRPVPGKKYQCSVMFRENNRGPFGLALPTLPKTLTPKEWIPVEELRSCLVVNITFRKGRKPGTNEERLIAHHEGRAIFPDNGTTVVEGKPMACLLREAGNVAFAIPIGVDQQTGKGLMRLAEKLGEVLDSDLKLVVVKAASKKSGVVGMPKAEADLDISGEYRDIYEVLSDPEAKVMVSESSTEDEVNKAYRRKTLLLHPDRVAQDFGGVDKVPLPIKKNAEFFFEALGTAKERALELIARKKAKSEKREAPKAEASPASDGSAGAQKADNGRKRDRKPRKEKGGAEQKPVTEAVASSQPVEAAPVEGASEAVGTEEPAQVEASSQEPAVTEPAVAETPAVAALSKEEAEMEEFVEAAKIAKKTVEEFVAQGDNIQKFYLRQARSNIRNRKAKSASDAAAKKASSEAKGSGPETKGDFRAQLAAVSEGMKK